MALSSVFVINDVIRLGVNYMVTGCIQLILGILLWALTISVGIAWIGFCFGTVIIGILLLIFAPRILLFPPLFISVFANGFLLLGLHNIKRNSGRWRVIDVEPEWVKTNDKKDVISGVIEDKQFKD
ncbi:hypothetical protein N8878_04445 [Psychromonas sp.]|nr:hypothetical protein [Psychromonas sp.]